LCISGKLNNISTAMPSPNPHRVLPAIHGRKNHIKEEKAASFHPSENTHAENVQIQAAFLLDRKYRSKALSPIVHYQNTSTVV
jgi:hypothetical protein